MENSQILSTLSIAHKIMGLYLEEKKKQAKRKGLPQEKLIYIEIYTSLSISSRSIFLDLRDFDFKKDEPYTIGVKNLIESYLKDIQYLLLQEENKVMTYYIRDLSEITKTLEVNIRIKPKE